MSHIFNLTLGDTIIKKQTILTFLATVLFSVLLLGCGGVPIRTLPPVTHNLPSIAPVNFTFPSQNNEGEEISDSAIIEAIRQAMATRYPQGGKLVKKLRASGIDSGKFVHVINVVDIIKEATSITASYNQVWHYPSGVRIASKLLAKYEIKITTSGNQKQVVMTPPSSIIVMKVTNYDGNEVPLERSVSEVEKDVRAVSASLDPTINFAKPIKGEINVKYSDESVYANFTRMMGSYRFSKEEAKKYDIKKDHVFALKHKNKPIPVKITVYPYRDGSKVVYEFEYPYSGKSGSQSEIDALIAEISRVVND